MTVLYHSRHFLMFFPSCSLLSFPTTGPSVLGPDCTLVIMRNGQCMCAALQQQLQVVCCFLCAPSLIELASGCRSEHQQPRSICRHRASSMVFALAFLSSSEKSRLKYVQSGDWLRMQIDCVFMRTFCRCRIHYEGAGELFIRLIAASHTNQVAVTAANNYFWIK